MRGGNLNSTLTTHGGNLRKRFQAIYLFGTSVNMKSESNNLGSRCCPDKESSIRFFGASLLLCFATLAQATTYTLTGAAYTSTSGSVYSGTTGIAGYFVTPVPLPGGLNNKNLSVALGCAETYCASNWSFFDGVYTYNETNSLPMPGNPQFVVTTDGSGNITDTFITLVQPITPTVQGQQANFIQLNGGTYTQAMVGPCWSISNGLCSSWSGPWNGGVFAYAQGGAYSFTGPPMAPALSNPVPALSEWGSLALAALLMLAGGVCLRRKDS
jgi:hypothetical protein